ncbi:DOPA-like domain-containing protein [Globomyces pollinis-pini]|nr:DOPA-like domain-containing protein [Globomyces pollinis-pini]
MEPTKAPQEMIKEYHFHTYWFLNDPVTESIAVDLFNQISLSNFGKPLRVNRSPVGPHPIGSFETWVPIEYFGEAYSFFTLNRKGLSVLLHPLTREEVKDHTERAMWMGAPMPLKVDQLTPLLDHVPAQYPELGLGNSKKA